MSYVIHETKRRSHDLGSRSDPVLAYESSTPRVSHSSHSRSTSTLSKHEIQQATHQPRRLPRSSFEVLQLPLTRTGRSAPELPLPSVSSALLSAPRLPSPLTSRTFSRCDSSRDVYEPLKPPERQSPPGLPAYQRPVHPPLPYWRVRQTSPERVTRYPLHVNAHDRLLHRPVILRQSRPARSPSPPPFRVGPKTYDPLRPEGLYQASKGAQRDLKWRQKQRQAGPAKTEKVKGHSVGSKVESLEQSARPAVRSFYTLIPRAPDSSAARLSQFAAIRMARAAEEKKGLEATIQNQVYSHARPTKCHWTDCEALCTSWALLEKHFACCHLHRDIDTAVNTDGLVVCGWGKDGKNTCGKTFATKQECLAHCIAKDGHMGEYDSRCPYNCTTNKRTFSDLMGHIAKRHRASQSPTIPLLLPTRPALPDNPPLPSPGDLGPKIDPEDLSRPQPPPQIPGLELYRHMVKPSAVSTNTQIQVLEKKDNKLNHDSLHSIPNQKAGGAAITALTQNAKNRRVAIGELRTRDATSEQLPMPSVFLTHDLPQLVADMMSDDWQCINTPSDNLDGLLEKLNNDVSCDPLVGAGDTPASTRVRVARQLPCSEASSPDIDLKTVISGRRASVLLLPKLVEPAYHKIDVKKLHKEVKTASAQAIIDERRAVRGSRQTRQSTSGSGTSHPGHTSRSQCSRRSANPADRLRLNTSSVQSGLSSSSSSRRSSRSSDADLAPPLTSISLSATSSSMSIGTSASSVFLPTPSSGGGRSPISDPQPGLGQSFALSDERGGSKTEMWAGIDYRPLQYVPGSAKRRRDSSGAMPEPKRRR